MKKLFFITLVMLSLSMFSHSAKAQYVTYEPISSVKIDDGWYRATVSYYNSATYRKSTYTLKVKVEYGSVTAIDFGNGGSIHSGYNNEGYTYSGGTLTQITDYQGNVTAVTARVMTSDRNGSRSYDITIQ
jgi:hypothetical protein